MNLSNTCTQLMISRLSLYDVKQFAVYCAQLAQYCYGIYVASGSPFYRSLQFLNDPWASIMCYNHLITCTQQALGVGSYCYRLAYIFSSRRCGFFMRPNHPTSTEAAMIVRKLIDFAGGGLCSQ